MEKKELTGLDVQVFPPEVGQLMAGQRVFDSSCSDAARVYYLESGVYIKRAPAGALGHEALMGGIFHRHRLGPEVMMYLTEGQDWLVTRAAPGEDLLHHLDKPQLLCEQIAQKLQLLHNLPVLDAPESPGLAQYRQGVSGEGQGFEKYVLMDRFPIRDRQEALALAKECLPCLGQDTLIHGDACLPNMMMENGKIMSFIDFAASGAGDRHVDLFWALWSMKFNLKTEKWSDVLLDAYGRQHIDTELIRGIAALEAVG